MIDTQNDMVPVPSHVFNAVLSVLRECKSDYCHPNFTDRRGTGNDIKEVLAMLTAVIGE